MAVDRHDDLDDLDELDEEPSFEIVVDEPKVKKPVNIKPLLIGLLVLVLGGSLGTGAYLFADYDTRDLIGLLDIGESAPRLSLELPGRGDPTKPAAAPRGGGLLTPPGAAGGAGASGEILKATPDDTPPPVEAAKAKPEMPLVPPAAGTTDATTSPPVVDPGAEALARLEAGGAPPPPAPKVAAVDASGMPTQPSPRTAEKQPPSYDTLETHKGEIKPLLAAPIKELQRKTQLGDLPYPAPDGREPWQVYARPWSGPADKGKVAVVVVELGLDKAATEAAIAKLPPEVTLAFSPYAPSLEKWIKKARDYGHEVLMSLPAETNGPRDPGPYGLMNAYSPESNLERLETVMSKGVGYTGLVSLGGVYGASPQIAATLGSIKEHGLLYLGDGSAPPDRTPPSAPITSVVDSDPFREAIDMRLNQVSIAARTKGRAVAVVNPRPLSFLRLLGWLNDFAGQNLVLAPASTVVQPPALPGKS